MDPGPPRDEGVAAEGDAHVLELPAPSRTTAIALDELELVYAFIYARVGNRPDAEDLTQQVAMKAIPRLRRGAPATAERSRRIAPARCGHGEYRNTRVG